MDKWNITIVITVSDKNIQAVTRKCSQFIEDLHYYEHDEAFNVDKCVDKNKD